MIFSFPRYIYGMLQTADKKNVGGDFRPIAYSGDFSEALQREVYKKVRPGITGDLLQEVGRAYAFSPLSSDDFIVAHYELMELTEPTSRGKPVFSEFLYITSSQLKQMDWNLFPIFQSFTKIEYYSQVVKNLRHAEIEYTPDDRWVETIRQ